MTSGDDFSQYKDDVMLESQEEASLRRAVQHLLEDRGISDPDGAILDRVLKTRTLEINSQKFRFSTFSQSKRTVQPLPHLVVNGEPLKQTKPTRPAEPMERIGRFLLSKGAYKRYIWPHASDIHHEYGEAIAQGNIWHARWIVVRGYLQVIWPLVWGAYTTIRAVLRISGG